MRHLFWEVTHPNQHKSDFAFVTQYGYWTGETCFHDEHYLEQVRTAFGNKQGVCHVNALLLPSIIEDYKNSPFYNYYVEFYGINSTATFMFNTLPSSEQIENLWDKLNTIEENCLLTTKCFVL